jgi:hypothetical protein
MHGTFKKPKTSEANPALQEKKQDTPDFMGRNWWVYKALYEPSGDLLQQIFSHPSQ